jgi:hypothetical protein
MSISICCALRVCKRFWPYVCWCVTGRSACTRKVSCVRALKAYRKWRYHYTHFNRWVEWSASSPGRFTPLPLAIGMVGRPHNWTGRFGEKNVLCVVAFRFLSSAPRTCGPFVGLKCVVDRAVEGLRNSFEQHHCILCEALFLYMRIS